jgi:sn-glycerol 3-phosphate transport system substrate-binding protein
MRLLQLAAASLALVLAIPANATTDIALWHAMSGELGRQLDKLASDFNASQSDYRIVPSYKGNYTETVTAAIFAFRSRSQPAIVQVNEVATATMTAAKGAIYPVFSLMQDQHEPFSPDNYLPAVSGYYTDATGNLLSFPFNASTPILYYNKTLFRGAGLDPEAPPKTWPELGAAAKRLRERGAACGFTTSWPSWIHVENFSALHDLPLSTKANGFAGLDAELTIANPVLVRHVAQLAEWQKDKVFDYSGRGQSAEPRFQNGECGIFIGSSATRADIKANSKFEVGYGMMPYWPDVKGAPQNSIIGGASLWVMAGKTPEEYKGIAKFFTFLSQTGLQQQLHEVTGYLPITKAAYEATKASGFYQKNPGREIPVLQMTAKPPTENSRGLRLGNLVQIRDIIAEDLEAVFAGKENAQAGLDDAVKRGNALLAQFEQNTR